MRDEAGLYYVLGRSDDVIKISGKRTGPSEIETLLMATGKLSEAAVVGIPDQIKGSVIACACVPMPGVATGPELERTLSNAIVDGMGGSFRPKLVLLVDDLPKTRNMKIMRRVIRSLICGENAGDLTSLVNPEAVRLIQERLGARPQSSV
jgi:acetyl-CoA synthetase